jgi:RNA polymerase sigma factor (sigma-70 family)
MACMMGLVGDDQLVTDLVARAKAGDQRAWDQIVERYAPLVWAVCRRHRLSRADTDDVGACVWLRLVERLDTIREPAALPGWLATTTRRECLRVLRTKDRETPVDDHQHLIDDANQSADDFVLAQERQIALRAAFAELSERCQHLLELLFTESRTSYGAIGETLGIPIGTIGPTRQRCLGKLRAMPALAALEEQSPQVAGERHD